MACTNLGDTLLAHYGQKAIHFSIDVPNLYLKWMNDGDEIRRESQRAFVPRPS